jgi:hypothetical protein
MKELTIYDIRTFQRWRRFQVDCLSSQDRGIAVAGRWPMTSPSNLILTRDLYEFDKETYIALKVIYINDRRPLGAESGILEHF